MNILKKMEMRDSAFIPYLNTGTLLDVQTGVFIPGMHNGMILNGGLASSNGVQGRQEMFKSTKMYSLIMRVMSYYPDTSCLTYDTERSLKKDRIAKFSPFDNQEYLEEHHVIQTPVDYAAEAFFENVKKIAAEKIAHPDDWLVETPFVDPRSGKPLMMLRPTIIAYDSWSEMTSSAVQKVYDTKELGSSDTNMVYMQNGRVKNMIMSQIPTLSARAGLCFLFAAHVGDKQDIGSYTPTPKVLPNMRASDKPKGVGSNFEFLVSNVHDIRKVEILHDGEKECFYPIEGGNPMELCEVTAVGVRCKNNMSGTQITEVVSKTKGILGDLSNYNYLRKCKYFGLLGSQGTHKPAMTDTSVSRTTIRQKLFDPKIARAIEILAQLCYMQENWVTTGADVDFLIDPAVLA